MHLKHRAQEQSCECENENSTDLQARTLHYHRYIALPTYTLF